MSNSKKEKLTVWINPELYEAADEDGTTMAV